MCIAMLYGIVVIMISHFILKADLPRQCGGFKDAWFVSVTGIVRLQTIFDSNNIPASHYESLLTPTPSPPSHPTLDPTSYSPPS